jgi:exosome complex component RRP42
MNKMEEHLLKAIDADARSGGRTKTEYRDITIETGVVKTAEGSAKVTIGETIVIAGVKMAVEKPYPDTADQGNLMVNVELLPLSSSRFESGPPSMEAIELARVTDRGIRESHAIDTKKLCIKEGDSVWSVIVDICTINASGNLFDACSVAAIAALKDAKFPKLEEKETGYTVNYKETTKESLPLQSTPIGVTICKMGDNLVVDPNVEEEVLIEGRLTVTSNEDGVICALQKGGESIFTIEEIDNILSLALEKSKELREKL